MKTHNILESISDVPCERVAFVSSGKYLTYGSIFQAYKDNLETIKDINFSCVAIRKQSRYDFALLLSLLDGKVKRILFVAEDIDDSLLDKHYKSSDVNYEVYIENNSLCYSFVKSPTVTNGELNDNVLTEWIIPTSGTTKEAKLVSHTFSSLTRSTLQDINKGGEYIWGLTFDIYRFSGIQVFLQSVLGGSTLIIPESHNNIQETIELFSGNDCNIISATPSFWRKSLMTKDISNLSLKRVTLGGEIADKAILTALKKQFPDVKIVHIYASTEAGVGFAVTDGQPGFPKSFLEDELINNIQISLRDNLLWIKPSTQSQKYLSQKEEMFDNKGYINTGDLVEIKGDRVFFLGRESGAINVGGNKVLPEEVEQVLLNSKLLNSAYVYEKKNPMMGALVCADIIPKNITIDSKDLKKQVLLYCKDNLAAFKRPAILKVVDEIAITKSGKVKRR